MKAFYLFLTLLCSLLLSSCSTLDEPQFVDNGTISDEEMDSITFNISFENNLSTRADFNPFKDYRVWRCAQKPDADYSGTWEITNRSWRPCYFDYDNEGFHDLRNSIVCNAISSYDSQLKYLLKDRFNYYFKTETKRITITIPKDIKDKSNLYIQVVNRGFVGSDLNYKQWDDGAYFYEHLHTLPFLVPSELQDSLSKRFDLNNRMSLNSNKNAALEYNEGDNILYITHQNKAVSAMHKVFNDDGHINNDIVLKRMNSAIIILSDEFNVYEPNFLKTIQENIRSEPCYSFLNFSSLDWKSNRRISEYFPDFEYEKRRFYDHLVQGKKYHIFSYDNCIFNLKTQKQYNTLVQYEDNYLGNKYETINDIMYGYYDFSNFDCPYNFLASTNRLYNVSSGRYFYPFASRLIAMPYGIPKTLDTKISKANTHFNSSDELNKDLKYLVVNVYAGWAEPKIETAIHNKWFRFVWEIPSEGLKPGYLYIIKNKPGTKLFKEWDEANATTRSGDDSEYIVDPNSIEIEEIPM